MPLNVMAFFSSLFANGAIQNVYYTLGHLYVGALSARLSTDMRLCIAFWILLVSPVAIASIKAASSSCVLYFASSHAQTSERLLKLHISVQCPRDIQKIRIKPSFEMQKHFEIRENICRQSVYITLQLSIRKYVVLIFM